MKIELDIVNDSVGFEVREPEDRPAQKAKRPEAELELQLQLVEVS